MATLHEEVISRLRASFPDLVDGLETTETKRVMGAVISRKFERLDDKARQDRISKVLEGLEPEHRRRIGPIVALTPAEAEIDVSADE